MLRRMMVPLADVKDLNAASDPIGSAIGPGAESYGVPLALSRQAPTALGIAKITELAQLLLGWGLALMVRSSASPTPAAAQRKPSRMRPLTI
jgi:hypothetical protein